MAQERIDIVVREDGSRVVKRNIENLGQSGITASKGIGILKAAIAAVVGSRILREMQQLADSYTTIQNRLRLTTSDQGNLNAVLDELVAISGRTRSSLEANVELYSRLSLAAKSLGASQAEILQFTESVNKAIKISGATAAEAEGGLRQLSQGLASGALRGDELNSVLENLPAVADVIAKSLGITRGQLRQMGQEGKITGDIILQAFREAREELDAKFLQTVPTIAEGFVLIKNQAIIMVGELDKATGASAALGEAMLVVVNFLKEATPAMINFARAITGTLDPTDEMSTGMKVFATIMTVIITVLQLVAKVIYTVVIQAFQNLGKLIGGIAASLGSFGKAIVATFTGVGNVLSSIGRAIAQAARGDFSDAGATLANAFGDGFDEAGGEFAQAGRILEETFVDTFTDTVGMYQDLGAELVDTTSMTIEKLIQTWDSGARQIQDRAAEVTGSINTEAGPAATVVNPAETREIEKLQRSLTSLLNTIAPLEGATRELAEAQDILARAREKNLITSDQETRFLELLQRYYKDILDPLGKLNRELDQQSQLLQMTARAREVETQLLSAQQDLLKQGVILTEAETQALREKLTALQQLNEVVALQDQLLSGSVDSRREFVNQITAIQNLLADPTSGFTQGDATNALSGMMPGMFEGTQEALDAQVAQYQLMYEQIDQLRQADLISEQTALQMKRKVAIQEFEFRTQNYQVMFSALASLATAGNKKLAAIGKAAAVAQAVIDGTLAIQKALASAPPPLNYALAAAVGVQQALNVSKIMSQGFQTGGSFKVGGSGGVDTQMVAFRASPGEQVQVRTPQQVRKGDPGGGEGSPVVVQSPPATVVVVDDPNKAVAAMQTSAGENVTLEHIRRNPEVIRQIIG